MGMINESNKLLLFCLGIINYSTADRRQTPLLNGWFDCLIWLCLYRIIYIYISTGGQLDGNFLPGSLPHKFILFVT